MKWKNNLLITIIFTSIVHIHSDELFNLNEQFIATYDRTRNYLVSMLNPLIICIKDKAIIIHRGKRYEEQVVPKLYHDLKSLSHVPFKIYLTVMFNSGNLSETNSIELQQYLEKIRSIRNSIHFPSDIQKTQYEILDLSIEYIQTILKTKFIDEIQLKNFCQQARHLFSINIEIAARAHLDMLDEKIRPWYQNRFNDTERNSLQVLITGSKTARHGSTEKAYFYKLLGERHEGKHIIYVENIDDEQKISEILGVWLLDAKASAMFFDGDIERLHRDILADAAKVHVKQLFERSKNEL